MMKPKRAELPTHVEKPTHPDVPLETSSFSSENGNGSEREESPAFMQGQSINVLPESVGYDHLRPLKVRPSEEKLSYSREEKLQIWRDSLDDSVFRRTEETDRLLRSYYAMQESDSKSFVLVSGPSGSGKTQLAQSLKATVTEQGGYFLTGKYDQLKRREPYVAYVSAFTEFTNAVLARGEEAREEMRSAIQTAVGEEAAILLGMIPSLEKILGRKDYSTSKARADEAIQRFVFVFRRFLRAVSSPRHPVVLLLDDLQWADYCSLDVLKSIVTDASYKGLVVIGTCDLTVSPDSFLSEKLREMETNEEVDIVHIQIHDLSEVAVGDLLIRVLETDPHQRDYRSFAGLVTQQTKGNLLYVSRLLKWLQQSDLLTYDDDDDEWGWDVEEIRDAIDPCDVAGFLGDILEQQIGLETREVLKVAACLGFHVEEELIEYVLGRPVASDLNEALVKGALVVDEARGGYAFSHDGVQEAAYRMIPEDERELFHVEVGRRLWRELDNDNLDRYIFVLLSQFKIGKRLVQREKERYAIATLCLHAGTKAARSSTFRTAAVYLIFGIYLVGERGWRDEYDLTLSLYNAGAEMDMCSGNFKRMDELIEGVLLHAKTALDKVQANCTRIYVLGSQDEQQKAIDLGVEVLQDLNELFPSRLCKAHLMAEIRSVQKLLRGKSDEQLMRMAPLDDPWKRACLHVLQLMFLNCLLIRPKLAPFVALKSAKITLLHGLSPIASVAFASYGMMLIDAGDVDGALRYGQLGLKLLDSYGTMEYLPRVYAAYYGVIHSWKFPISEALEPLLRAHRVGLQTGDHEFAFLCSNCYCFLALESGVPLGTLMSKYSTFEESMVTNRQKMTLRMSLPFVQAMSFYMNPPEDPLSFRGSVLDMLQEEAECERSGRINQVLTSRLCRMEIAFVFNAHEEGYILSKTVCDAQLMVPTIEQSKFHFLRGMIALAMARKGKNARKNVRTAKEEIRWLRPLARKSPHNLLDKLFMLEGELASVCGCADEAYEKYISSIALAKDSTFLYTQALGNEQVCRHFLALGQKQRSEPYFHKACQLYSDWGGRAKVLLLKAELDRIYSSK